VKLHYQATFSKDTPTQDLIFLFVHGLGGTHKLFRPVVAGLEAHFHTVSVDQRGHGQSLVPSDELNFSPLTMGRDLLTTLEDVNASYSTNFRVIVVGHSMGVRSAAALAHLAPPDQIAALVLVDLGFAGLASGGLGDALSHFFPLLPPTGFVDRSELKSFLSANCPDESIARYLNAASLLDPHSGRYVFPFQAEVLLKIIESSKDSTIRPWVEEFARQRKSVLVLRGAQSQVWRLHDFNNEKNYFAKYPTVQFKEYENAGHGLPFDQKARFLDDLKEIAVSC